jgi:hypothetical protein
MMSIGSGRFLPEESRPTSNTAVRLPSSCPAGLFHEKGSPLQFAAVWHHLF